MYLYSFIINKSEITYINSPYTRIRSLSSSFYDFLEFIPLDELNAEIAYLLGFANRDEAYDVDRLDHLFEW